MFNFFPKHGGSYGPARTITSGSVAQTGETVMTFVQTNKVVLNGDISTAANIANASIPTNSQGAQALSLLHTPLRGGNLLRIRVLLDSKTSGSQGYGCALFVNSETNARAHFFVYPPSGTDTALPLFLEYDMVAINTSPITFAVRYGCNATNTITLYGGGTTYGGVQQSFLCVDEYETFPSARQ
jgi:hypothetical protein